MVVGMASVNAPLPSSIRTRSLPPFALTVILAILARSKEKSAEPSSPTSTSRVPGSPAWRRSAILSLALVPEMLSTPALSFGALNFGGYEPCAAPAMIPAAAATSASSHSACRALSRMKCFMCCVSFRVSRVRLGVLSLEMVGSADARSHRGDPLVFARDRRGETDVSPLGR
jgi:hypothetical protein